MPVLTTLKTHAGAFAQSPTTYLKQSRASTLYWGAHELGKMVSSPRLYFSDIPTHPSGQAVIVVDMINGFLSKGSRLYMQGAAEQIIVKSNRVIDAARHQGIPVLYLCDSHSASDEELKNWPKHCGKRTWESMVHPLISQPQRKAEVFAKSAFSAFKTTNIDEVLKGLGVKELFILGVATEYCDEANSTDAVDRGYKVWVVSDGIREVDLNPGDGERAIHRMAAKGVRFLDTAKVVDKMERREYQMPFRISPTYFQIGPSIAENARPIVTEDMAGRQAEFARSLNYRVDPFKASLTQTDMYQLTMANLFYQACHGTTPIAHFEMFIRKMPEGRNFMIMSGLQDFLHWMKNVTMDEKRINFVLDQPIIRDSVSDLAGFADYLRNFKFKLDVWAYPEGEFFMPNETIVGVSGPIEQVLLAETYLLASINSGSAFSTRAAQYRLANPGMSAIAMEMRRMDPELSEKASFEAWKQGFIGTSNTEAAFQYGIAPVGTNSHAMYLAFDNETDAIRSWMQIYRNYPMVLTDTFNTLVNALKTVKVLREGGMNETSFRTDSGHLAELMAIYQRILEANGITINAMVATNDLTPAAIAEMYEQKCNATAGGMGTQFGQVPATPGVLKLSELDGPDGSKFICKFSAGGKSSLPGIHQVWRRFDESGKAVESTVALLDERVEDAKPMMVPFTSGGCLLRPYPDKTSLREQYTNGRNSIPQGLVDALTGYLNAYEYPVVLSERAAALRDQVVAEVRERELDPFEEQVKKFLSPEEFAKYVEGNI